MYDRDNGNKYIWEYYSLINSIVFASLPSSPSWSAGRTSVYQGAVMNTIKYRNYSWSYPRIPFYRHYRPLFIGNPVDREFK
jgi:hypothetical protein